MVSAIARTSESPGAIQSAAQFTAIAWALGITMAIGALAGALGDPASLGFVAETERQVETHLRRHMQRLDAADTRSRAILEQMTNDEVRHGAQAASLGAAELPVPVAAAMRMTARIMTRGSYWL